MTDLLLLGIWILATTNLLQAVIIYELKSETSNKENVNENV